ncbi:trehalose-phosphatase [Aurantiacibacter spongiae]|uniref:Trehalose 6-phosphate phosphatase n=1 Tax=Aurantiacibacter spongiae TaxID=2488860 RepID=A0A3N5DLE4_9SPHN|nr:trehalose-phosphatase [Aurantiacibacter spongiae]RPF72512.1 trehalose-phosphatase [Aurantiacibacter spongiae]
MSEPLPPPPDLAALRSGQTIALFLDFDGTLVELADTPDAITVPSNLHERLCALADRLGGRLALVSGRAIVDLERHVGPVALACAGSHGGHCRDATGRAVGNVPGGLPPRSLADIRDFAQEHGFALEDKPHGAALHYRADPSLEERGLAFARDIAAEHDLDVKRGKFLIELVGRGANKGSAVRAFMDRDPFAGAVPVFVGDDVTDEDGMCAAADLGGFGIAVGDRRNEQAKYNLASVAAVHHWLGL